MVVTTTPSTSAGTSWIRLSGTILEVLNALAAQNASALNVSYWSDDGADAVAVMCRQE